MLVKGFSPRKSMVMEYNELVYFTGLLNLSKVLYRYSFWPPSGLKNRTQKTIPQKIAPLGCGFSKTDPENV